MNINKLFCMLIAGLAIIGFTTLGYASQEEASHSDDATTTEAASEQENANEEADSVQSTDDIQSEDIQYGAKPNLELGEQEVKAEEKE
jgi:hypothetical protein